MKINKVKLTDRDKRRALKTAVRKAIKESGLDKVTRSGIYRNRKKYTRKKNQLIIRREESL